MHAKGGLADDDGPGLFPAEEDPPPGGADLCCNGLGEHADAPGVGAPPCAAAALAAALLLLGGVAVVAVVVPRSYTLSCRCC